MLTKIIMLAMMTVPGDVGDSINVDLNMHSYLEKIRQPQIYSLMTEEIDTLMYRPFQVENKFPDFLSGIYEEYYSHKELVDNWIKIMTFPEGKRAIIDKWTIDILDTIPDTRKARRNYKYKWDKNRRKDLKSAAGRLEATKEGFKRFDKYQKIFKEIFAEHDLPEELTYLPMPESRVSVVRSRVGAQGPWQIMKGTKGDLVINGRVDERNSIVRSTERAADKLSGFHHGLFGHYMLDATAYIRGEYGVVSDLEDMLDLEKQGEFFNSYSGMVFFHVHNDHRIMSEEEFWKRTVQLINNKSGVFTDAIWNGNYKYRYKKQAPEGLYESYLQDVGGDDTVYVKPFWNYYDLDVNPRDVYWQYHEYLKNTKNNFDTPQYVPRLIAAIMLHSSDFDYERQKPLDIEEFDATRQEIKDNYSDEEFRELNRHIKSSDLKRGNVPSYTKVYRIQE